MKISEEKIVDALKTSLSELTSRSMTRRAVAKCNINLDSIDRLGVIKLMLELSVGIKLYIKEKEKRDICTKNLVGLFELPDTWEKEFSLVVGGRPKQTWKREVESVPAPRSVRKTTSIPVAPVSLSSMPPVPIDEMLVLSVLGQYLSNIIAKSVWRKSLALSAVDLNKVKRGDTKRLLKELQHGVRLYISGRSEHEECAVKLRSALLGDLTKREEDKPVTIHVKNENDIVTARSAGMDLCQSLGFSKTAQIKIATAISELTRNIVQYAGYGQVRMRSLAGSRKGIEVIATDDGPGISNLQEILNGDYVSKRGMGKGIVGTKNLMDFFEIRTEPRKGTTVTTRKFLDKQWI